MARSSHDSIKTINPCTMPKLRKAASYPLDLIMLEIGTTVRADPAPKPAAVKPAARPARSGNHLVRVATQVP